MSRNCAVERRRARMARALRRARPVRRLPADPSQAPTRSRSAGISLIEVMIAMAILGFGILAGAAAQLTAIKMTSQSRMRTEAYYLAEQQMELFRSMNGAGVAAVRADANYANNPNDPASPIDPDPNDGLPRSFNRSWTITPNDPDTGLFAIEVRVVWIDGLGLPRVVRLQTIKTDT